MRRFRVYYHMRNKSCLLPIWGGLRENERYVSFVSWNVLHPSQIPGTWYPVVGTRYSVTCVTHRPIYATIIIYVLRAQMRHWALRRTQNWNCFRPCVLIVRGSYFAIRSSSIVVLFCLVAMPPLFPIGGNAFDIPGLALSSVQRSSWPEAACSSRARLAAGQDSLHCGYDCFRHGGGQGPGALRGALDTAHLNPALSARVWPRRARRAWRPVHFLVFVCRHPP